MDTSPDIPKQNLSQDINKILNQYRKQILPEYHRWQAEEPALQQLNQFTSGTMIPRLTGLLNNYPNINQSIAPLQRLLASQPNVNQTLAPVQQVSRGFQQRMGNLMNVAPTLQQTMFGTAAAPGGLSGILTSQGAPSLEQQRTAQQGALQTMSQGGNLYGNQAAVADVLRRHDVQQQNFNQAVQNAAALQGIQTSDVGARLGLGQGITSAQQALDAIRSADINRRLGLTTGIQGIRGTDVAQQLGLMQGISGAITNPMTMGIGSFNALMNPLMGFAGNVFDANQNAAAAQNIAGANKNAGTTSGILNALGSIGGGYLQGGGFAG